MTSYIAAISDTHVGDGADSLPDNLLEILRNRKPDFILHAGDIGNSQVITELETFCPTITVRGDNDNNDFPRFRVINIDNKVFILDHGDRNILKEFPSKYVNRFFKSMKLQSRWWNGFDRDLYEKYKSYNPDFIICGHLHHAFMKKINNTTILNPGAVYQKKIEKQISCIPSISFINIDSNMIDIEFVSLLTKDQWCDEFMQFRSAKFQIYELCY